MGMIASTAGFLALLILAELALLRRGPSLEGRLRAATFFMLQTGVGGAIVVLMGALWGQLGVKALLEIPFDRLLGWSGPLQVVLAPMGALMIADFVGYWYHRVQHTALWPVHAVHHSVEDLHAASSYGHPSDEFFKFLLMVVPLSLVPTTGFVEPVVFTALASISILYIHSPIPLHYGPLRYVFTDNRFHRIHHSVQPEHFGKNYGTFFTLWDQVFGTAYFPKPGEWPKTGLADMPEPQSIREFLDLPWRYVVRGWNRPASPLPPTRPHP
jgi:sterol desaturase/sphingolipid hydroxylase (fatty acid hydroxylase superfamily)